MIEKVVLAALKENKNALYSSVESRVFVDTMRSEEANRAQACVIQRGGGSAYKRAGDARCLP